jgi:hypothetical protein
MFHQINSQNIKTEQQLVTYPQQVVIKQYLMDCEYLQNQ